MRLILFISLFFLIFNNANLFSQDIKFAHKIISEISSSKYAGRGYSENGDSLTAFYIIDLLKKNKIESFDNSYTQNFNISVNTFHNNISLKLNGNSLIPGLEYLVSSSSNTIKGKFPVIVMNYELMNYPEKLQLISKDSIEKSFLLIDTFYVKNKGFKDAADDIIKYNLFNAKGIIETEYKNLMYIPSQTADKFPRVKILKGAIPDSLKFIDIEIENDYKNSYNTRNIIGYIHGEIDSFIVFSAHYDHLGQMGKDVYFPGANDNASGVALVLDMAKYFSKNSKKLKYSIAFIFFSGEELGLLGSSEYVKNPKFPLEKIKFLINLDMVGSGEKGIKVVNATEFTSEFELLKKINAKNNYLPEIYVRGPAANSDHYPFYKNGVKSFFIYTLGEYSEYHNIYDKSESLPLNKYEALFKLLVNFSNQLN
ncbi:MAG: M20/M25/M40 family metallo-hydrolase [Bacteroidales bacterium]|nr:M20/M25/M40 family metallo-hydrolase [Bacteroidales bacterium]MBN2758820.1 M20/M25/M40 family metallo-hydrolase [Bacteroidales bacterium]